MHPHEGRIRDLYDSLKAHDGEAAARCYHPDATFSDPVFPMLHGSEVGEMWRMLLARAADLEVSIVETHGDEAGGWGYWVANYTFSRTGRKVNNHITSQFAFRDGLIVRQVDYFSFWMWSWDAFGALGGLFGWLPPLKWKVRRDAAKALKKWCQGRIS